MRKFKIELIMIQHKCLIANNMACLRWKQKHEVCILTTYHCNELIDSGKKYAKTGQGMMMPTCVKDYNNSIGARDKTDMLLSSLECVCKTEKWYKRNFSVSWTYTFKIAIH